MKRIWRCAVGLGFGLSVCTLAQATPSKVRPECVSGGAPFVQPPAFDDLDRFFFATADASVHSFEPDGRYRFTVTLNALPVGTLVRPDGHFFVVTADRRLHAFSADGLELWHLTLFEMPKVGPFPVGPGKLGVLGMQGELAVFDDSGTRLYTLRAPRTRGSPIASGGFLWLGTDTGDLRAIEGAWRTREIVFDGEPVLVGPAPGGALLVRSGTDLLRVDMRGLERLESRVRFATQRGGYTGLVLGQASPGAQLDLALLDAKGRNLARVRLSAPTRIAPAVGKGEVFAALADGRIQVLGPERRAVLAGFPEAPRGLVAGRRALLGLFGGDRICLLP